MTRLKATASPAAKHVTDLQGYYQGFDSVDNTSYQQAAARYHYCGIHKTPLQLAGRRITVRYHAASDGGIRTRFSAPE